MIPCTVPGIVLTLPLLLAAGLVHAVDSLEAGVASISGDDWSVAGLEVVVDLGDGRLSGDVRIERIDLPAADLSFSDVAIHCRRMEFNRGEFGCLAATVDAALPGQDRETFSGEAFYGFADGGTRFKLRDVPLAGGLVSIEGVASASGLDLEFSAEELQLDQLALLANTFGTRAAVLQAAGTAGLAGTLSLRNGALSRAALTWTLAGASVANQQGTLVTDSLNGRAELTLVGEAAGWRLAGKLLADAGEAYLEPIYLNLADHPAAFAAQGVFDPAAASVLELTTFTLTQGTQIEADGRLQVRTTGNDEQPYSASGVVELQDSSIDALYSDFLQVLLAGTVAGELKTGGSVSGTLAFHDLRPSSAALTLVNASAVDAQGRFSVHGLDGEIRWPGPGGRAGEAGRSRISWDSASAFAIPLEAGGLTAALGGDDLHLLEPLRLPTMGGALVVSRLIVDNYGKEDASGLLDAEVEPIQLAQLSSAFGWPAFAGTLAGQLPSMQYVDGVMTVGGTLSASAFDGAVEFANLRLEQPFGLVPRLQGDLRLRRLDLEQLTSTFSFGLIQGRLSGDVTGLQLVAWQPVAMDLNLYTAEGKDFRRRISQRAVENLSSVGGGGAATAALSSGVMKFFEDFSYRRIGIRCVLEDGSCAMSGVGPTGDGRLGQGYYIVQGSGLPRIDVVGYRHQVSWAALVRQLDNITASGTQ